MLIRWIKRLVLLTWLLLTIIAIGAVVAHYKLKEALAQPLALSENTEIQIRAGQSVRTVLLQWQQQGWIKDEIWLRLALKRQPELANIKVGTYELSAAISAQDALQQLVDGKELQFSVTLVEGGTIAQWLTQVASLERLTHSIESPTHLAELLGIDNVNPEGWFYPDTYSYSAGSSDLDIFRRAYLRMEQALTEAWEQRQDNLPLKSPYEMLILASIVEKETAVAEERPMVASVFVNRLNIGMRLQTDPTV
ncbi:MAG: endolytic transglycosylase MltG, partial [Ferrimonas sp.]